jgi:hypothetical protein
MHQQVKVLQNSRRVIFDKGKFDDWCVYVVEKDGTKKAPFDKTYFEDLYRISQKYPADKVYNDFVLIYDKTTKAVEHSVLTLIEKIVTTYNKEDQTSVEQWMTVLYAGMVAEENKDKTVLKKRIKRLGMHQVLVLTMPAEEAAKFSKGRKWKELDAIMLTYGF